MKKILIFIIILWTAPACVSLSGNHSAQPGDQLNAENRLMRNNLNLALRENEVLKEENLQYKAETARLKSDIKGLNDDINGLNKKYDTDTARMTEKYNNLSDQYALLENSTREKIQELTDLNQKLDKKMKSEIFRLNVAMAKQKASFEKTRQSLEQDHAGKEKEFAARLLSMTESLTEKTAVIASMKARYDEAQMQIENLRKEVDNYKTKVDDMGGQNQPPTESNRNLQKTEEDKPKEIEAVTGKDQPLSKPDTPASPAAGNANPQAQ